MKKVVLVLSFMMLGVFGFPGTELSSNQEKLKTDFEVLDDNPCYVQYCHYYEDQNTGEIREHCTGWIEVECDQ